MTISKQITKFLNHNHKTIEFLILLHQNIFASIPIKHNIWKQTNRKQQQQFFYSPRRIFFLYHIKKILLLFCCHRLKQHHNQKKENEEEQQKIVQSHKYLMMSPNCNNNVSFYVMFLLESVCMCVILTYTNTNKTLWNEETKKNHVFVLLLLYLLTRTTFVVQICTIHHMRMHFKIQLISMEKRFVIFRCCCCCMWMAKHYYCASSSSCFFFRTFTHIHIYKSPPILHSFVFSFIKTLMFYF